MSGLSHNNRQMFAMMTQFASSIWNSPHPCRDEAKDVTIAILSLAVVYVQNAHKPPTGWGNLESIDQARKDIINGQELTKRELNALVSVFHAN